MMEKANQQDTKTCFSCLYSFSSLSFHSNVTIDVLKCNPENDKKKLRLADEFCEHYQRESGADEPNEI